METYSNHLVYRIIRYGLQHQSFLIKDLFSALNLSVEEQSFVKYHFIKDSSGEKPNHILASHQDYLSLNFADLKKVPVSVLPNAVFQYNDYLEIQAARIAASEARIAANKANTLALIAIIFSVAVGFVQIAIAIYYAK